MALLHWLVARLSSLFWRTETAPAHIVSGMALCGWSFILSTNKVFDASNLYDYLSDIAAEPFWAFLTLILGVVQVVEPFLPRQSTTHWARIAFWVFPAAFWLYITAIAVLAVPTTTIAASSAVFAVACIWGFVREVDIKCR